MLGEAVVRMVCRGEGRADTVLVTGVVAAPLTVRVGGTVALAVAAGGAGGAPGATCHASLDL